MLRPMRRDALLPPLLAAALAGCAAARGDLPPPFFHDGQAAARMLSGPGFGLTYGPSVFHHPAGLATDGASLLLADRNNNRVLIWDTAPRGDAPPDRVLGQPGFDTSAPGDGLDQLNWPVDVTTGGGRVVVADSYNHRLLVWRSPPTRDQQPADFAIDLAAFDDYARGLRYGWPWAAWTDGEALVAAATHGAAVLIWRRFPADGVAAPDVFLRAVGPDGRPRFGTPRTIATDGQTWLSVGDHNARGEPPGQGSFFWAPFPTEDRPYDFFLPNPFDRPLMWGAAQDDDGRFISLATPGLAIWDALPTAGAAPALRVECGLRHGAGSGAVITDDGRLYLSLHNGNKVVGYEAPPTREGACPDYVIGAGAVGDDPLRARHVVTSPLPATDGLRLYVTSDFDRTLSVYRSLPSESGAAPDAVYDLDFPPWDSALWRGVFAAGGRDTVAIWSGPPQAAAPDHRYRRRMGDVALQEVRGVALDDRYLYVADSRRGEVYAWPGPPAEGEPPAVTLRAPGARRLSSDGAWLAVTRVFDHRVDLYRVDDLASGAPAVSLPAPGAGYQINLPEGAHLADGRLFIADTGRNRVFGWRRVEDAVAGRDPDLLLGARELADFAPDLGAGGLFWPAGLAYAGHRLWVGEFKFSYRLLEYAHPLDAGRLPRIRRLRARSGPEVVLRHRARGAPYEYIAAEDPEFTVNVQSGAWSASPVYALGGEPPTAIYLRVRNEAGWSPVRRARIRR